VEEKLVPIEQEWSSFLVEFPSFPTSAGTERPNGQSVLFLCRAQTPNPRELGHALFGQRTVIRGLHPTAPVSGIMAARLLVVYDNDPPRDLGPVIEHYRQVANVPALVVWQSVSPHAARAVRAVLESQEPAAREASEQEWPEGIATAAAAQAPMHAAERPLASEATIWPGRLPAIIMRDGKERIQASTDIQDYRAEYACRYVLAHFAENINRDRMAEMVNLSPGYFSNLFRAEVGMSFSDYLIQVRIENAKRLLRRFDLSVEAVSRQCGFNSLAHFSRTFKDRCGVSPLKYRKSPNSCE
jgi:AraC-like DNA-binding protein